VVKMGDCACMGVEVKTIHPYPSPPVQLPQQPLQRPYAQGTQGVALGWYERPLASGTKKGGRDQTAETR
jgi:hypothetical protein